MHLIYNFYSNFAIQIASENSHLGKAEYRDTLVYGGAHIWVRLNIDTHLCMKENRSLGCAELRPHRFMNYIQKAVLCW